jgi:gamma-glutamylputrescine oxidase
MWDGGGALEGEVSADVCVVGLGGSGLECIRELQARGQRVVGIDARGVAGGAAGRNGGFLLGGLAMFHHDATARIGRERAIAIYRMTLEQIARMRNETPAAVRATGSLRIAASSAEQRDCDRQYDAMRCDGLPVERYEGVEGSGLLFPADSAFDPALRCGTLAIEAVRAGARLFERSPALSISGGAVRTPRGVVHCGAVVVAVDGGLEILIPEVRGRVRSARLQMLATAPERVRFTRPIYARWGLDYWQQLPNGCVVLGGFRDVGGEDEWTASGETSGRVQAALTRFLNEELRVTAPVTHRWAASVGYSSSGLPILEEVRPGVWAAGAYSGTGNVVGAICGRAAAELATSGLSPIAALFDETAGTGG